MSSIAFLKKYVETVIFDAEHFFNGYLDNADFALNVLAAAAEAGADFLVLCDTNGGCLPDQISKITKVVVDKFPQMRIGIHTHNDSGLAVAGTISAVQAGASMVQGTINGLGERTGNADLTQIIPNLQCKLGVKALSEDKLHDLTAASRLVYEVANLPPRDHQPFVGRSAFAHKGGIHVSAIQRNSRTYEHIAPELVGNQRRILVSDLSGRSNIETVLPKEVADNADLKLQVLKEVMERENCGYSYENAVASLNLLVQRISGVYRPFFSVEHFRVNTAWDNKNGDFSEATIKVNVNGQNYYTVADSVSGPVSALDKALRKALEEPFPILKDLRLIDYRVHIVNATSGTAAKVRVVIKSLARGQGQPWGTVGVSADIISASIEALTDSIEYALFKSVFTSS